MLAIAVSLPLIVIVFFAIEAAAAAIVTTLATVLGLAVTNYARPRQFGDGPSEVHPLLELDLDQHKVSKQPDGTGAGAEGPNDSPQAR